MNDSPKPNENDLQKWLEKVPEPIRSRITIIPDDWLSQIEVTITFAEPLVFNVRHPVPRMLRWLRNKKSS